jgi:phage protein D
MEPNFPNTGASTLTGHGLNVLHKLRTRQYTDTYANKRPSQIAREIAQKSDTQTHRRRFPLQVDISQSALNSETPLEYVSQRSQYDIDFLFTLARRVGYVLYVHESDDGTQRLYFGPSQGDANQPLRSVTYELKYGVSLMDFKPTLNAAGQARSVTVRGYNRATASAIRETVSIDDALITINRDLLPILRACDPREDVSVNEPVRSAAEARQRAAAILMERYKEFVTAQGTSFGLPDLRAGMQVKILGIGSRFSGIYFVTETTHTISESGYLTRFSARREDPG